MAAPARLDQLDRLADRGVVRGRVGEEQLVEAESQRGEDRRVEAAQRAVDEAASAASMVPRRCTAP